MQPASIPRSGHSAEVELLLLVGDRLLSLSEIGPSHVTLREPIELPPTRGEIIMRVDGRERRWQVQLPDGARTSDTEIYAPTVTDS